MADVSKVSGDTSRPEPEKAKKKENDLEEIREKWGKVGKVDPEQQKKKKPKAQEEEERRVEQTSAPGQGLGAKPTEPSIYEPKEGRGPRVGEGVEAGPLPPSEPPPFYPEPLPLEEEPPAPPEHKKKVEKKEKVPTTPAPPKHKKVAKEVSAALPPKAKKLEKEAEVLLKKAEPKENRGRKGIAIKKKCGLLDPFAVDMQKSIDHFVIQLHHLSRRIDFGRTSRFGYLLHCRNLLKGSCCAHLGFLFLLGKHFFQGKKGSFLELFGKDVSFFLSFGKRGGTSLFFFHIYFVILYFEYF